MPFFLSVTRVKYCFGSIHHKWQTLAIGDTCFQKLPRVKFSGEEYFTSIIEFAILEFLTWNLIIPNSWCNCQFIILTWTRAYSVMALSSQGFSIKRRSIHFTSLKTLILLTDILDNWRTVKDFMLNYSLDNYGLHLNCPIMVVCQRKRFEMVKSML